MAYSDVLLIKKRLSPDLLLALSDDSGTGNLNSPEVVAVIDEAIGQADSIINSHLSPRYQVPLTGTVPDSISEISCTLAVCILFGRRSLALPETWEMEREFDLNVLEKLREGKILLDEIPDLGTLKRSVTEIESTTEGKEKNLSLDSLSRY